MKGKDMGMWIAIGAGIGTALGVALNNIGVGIALGAGIGVAIGASQGAFGSKKPEDEILEDENSRALHENDQSDEDSSDSDKTPEDK